MEPGMKKRPLQALARLFNKSQKKSEKSDGPGSGKGSTCTKKSSSARDIANMYDNYSRSRADTNFKLSSTSRLDISSPSEVNFDEAALEAELEALHMSRVDNPFIQVLSSQDNLDRDPRSPSTSLTSPPSDQSATFSPTLSEIHSHLIRSPPPINWPMHHDPHPRYFPVSPRSTGTFSPDSSDGLELDNIGVSGHLDNQSNALYLKTNAVPSRGYSPYNFGHVAQSRSHSEEHILSPCRDLLDKSSALFSPIRGTNDLMMTSTMSPRSGSCYDYQNRRNVGRASSFASTVRSTGSSRITLNQISSNVGGSRRSFYYTMNYDDEVDPDEAGIISPNKNQMSCEFGAISPTSSSTYGHRRSLAGLTGRLPMSAFSSGNFSRQGNSGWSCSLNRRRNLSKPDPPSNSAPGSGGQRPFFFSSWRRSYSSSKGSKRMTSPATSSSRKRGSDVKSMENLLSAGEDMCYKKSSMRQLETTSPFDC